MYLGTPRRNETGLDLLGFHLSFFERALKSVRYLALRAATRTLRN